MTAPVEETVETHPPTPGDRIRVRPRGVRARVMAGTPGARARVRALTPTGTPRGLPPVPAVPGTRAPDGRTAVAEPVDAAYDQVGGRSRDGAAAAPSQAAPTGAPAEPPTESRTTPDTGSRLSSRFTRALRAHFGTLAGTVILAVVFWRMGTGVFVDGLRRIDGGTLAAAVGIGVLTTVFSAWRWCAVTRALGLRLPLGPAVADYYRALFLNAALPGGVLGDVHRAVRHGQSSGDMGRGVRAVVIERTAGQLVLAVVGVTVLLVLPSPVLEQTRHVAGITTLAALGALAIWAAVRMGRRPSTAGGRGRRVRAALVEARGVLLNRDSGPAVLVSSVAVLAGYVVTFLFAARVAGSTAGAARLLPLALLALIAMSLPLNVGGWGPREGVTAWSFGAAGLGASQGLTVAVVYGVLSFAAALPGALVLVGRWYGSLRARRQSSTGKTGAGTVSVPQASEVTNEKYAPKESTNPASNSFPFAADARDGRPMTPESV
ncbi:flippase-like domain-containing protein [Streptomyces phaeolivaceus]|uniref:Flippase-like domain-containing protein n=1 Tax=Streptomyces phaeolivaceus TaxID=2653200 RepID=A0A5P8KDL4_9ACTN|nr:lysylphosphatidylglycerol synthase transmembrane domain-containing protein [Streptomyces phaeolivaceus]QFR01356.1 flippase-like domain-containing protein [Streptomyces phaeolivaceus]